jgi:hypothetical protein
MPIILANKNTRPVRSAKVEPKDANGSFLTSDEYEETILSLAKELEDTRINNAAHIQELDDEYRFAVNRIQDISASTSDLVIKQKSLHDQKKLEMETKLLQIQDSLHKLEEESKLPKEKPKLKRQDAIVSKSSLVMQKNIKKKHTSVPKWR